MRINAVISGVVLSGMLHAGVLAWFSTAGLQASTNHAGLDAWDEAIVPLAIVLPEPPEVIPPEPVVPPVEPEVKPPPPVFPEGPRLGIDDSPIESDNWQGFKEETAHTGPLASTDQSALALAPGAGGRPSVGSKGAVEAAAIPAPPVPMELPKPEAKSEPVTEEAVVPEVAKPEPAREPTEAVEKEPQETEIVEAPKPVEGPVDPVVEEVVETPATGKEPSVAPIENPEGDMAEGTKPVEEPSPVSEVPAGEVEKEALPEQVEKVEEGETEAPVEKRGEDEIAEEEVLPQRVEAMPPPPTPAPVIPVIPEVKVAETVADSLAPNPQRASAPSPESAASVGGDGAGEASDRESDASSRVPDFSVKPGKVMAGVGIQVKTVRPRWSTTTRLTVSPKNPVIEVMFGSDGRVAKARFLKGRKTGYKEVDGPLLDSVYRWTATGKKLEEATGPDGTVSFVIKMILTNEPESDLLPQVDSGE